MLTGGTVEIKFGLNLTKVHGKVCHRFGIDTGE